MRIAFYAPMKAASDPLPSGDREMARGLLAALKLAGHDVREACRFRGYDATGDSVRQRRLGALGARLATALIRRYRHLPATARPQLWFSYHLYHKAPDWLGPAVSRALAIPYVVAEASHAPKQATGPWAFGLAAAAAAIGEAAAVIGVNSADRACVQPLLADPARHHPLPPFLDTGKWRAAMAQRDRHRTWLASTYGLDTAKPWLITVAMMRAGDKLASYRLLGRALGRLLDRRWQLLIVGDGPARPEVKTALKALEGRVRWLGEQPRHNLPEIVAACELSVWPAIGEAYGLALLEAQAAGVPVVAGATGGVGDIIDNGRTGRLTAVGDAEAFAAAVAGLLDRPAERLTMARQAAERAGREHDIRTAARRLNAILAPLV